MGTPLEIVLPETKPETEWVRGRALRKVSPTYPHALAQLAFGSALRAWARGRGRVGTEWRFRVDPPGEPIRPLVPDVAYLSYGRLPADAFEEASVPLGAPDVAVEVRSAGDRDADIEDKLAAYLAAGAALVVLVDPASRRLTAIDPDGREVFEADGAFRHPALPGFELEVATLFEE
jgi:Uma2 family endonuclease